MINLILKRAALHLLSSNRVSNFNHIRFRFLHNPINHKLEQDSSFTVSYLINSCGLSPESALSASRKIQVKSAQDSDSLIQLLKSHEFTDAQITKIVTKHPQFLTMKLEDNLKPKMNYFQSIGLSNPEIASLILTSHGILKSSLENRLKPNFELLISVFGNVQKVAAAAKQTSRLLQLNLELDFVPNMHVLQALGVSDVDIARLFRQHPRVALFNHEKFVELVATVKDKGFDPKSSMFCYGIAAMARLNSWDYKMAFFNSLGWLEEEVKLAFLKHPNFMLISEEKMKKMIDFYSQKFMWQKAVLSKFPVLAGLSLEKRVLPRYMVLNVLASKGLVKRKPNVKDFLISEKDFSHRYITSQMNHAPEVLEAYRRSEAASKN